MKFLSDRILEALDKLGVVGTISYIGGLVVLLAVTGVNFNTEINKAILLLSVGSILLIFSGIIYWLDTKEETVKIKEALGVLREVYNRMAEQISSADKDKTVSITMTIDNLPDKISEVVKKTTKV